MTNYTAMNYKEKLPATYFKEEVEQSINRYGNLSVYETIGALEVVKQNLLERLGRMTSPENEDQS